MSSPVRPNAVLSTVLSVIQFGGDRTRFRVRCRGGRGRKLKEVGSEWRDDDDAFARVALLAACLLRTSTREIDGMWRLMVYST